MGGGNIWSGTVFTGISKVMLATALCPAGGGRRPRVGFREAAT
jgi:hypothetical protein